MSFLQPGKRCRTGGSKRFFRNFLPRYWLCQSLFSLSGCFLCLSMWKAKVEHTLLFYSWPKKLCHLLLGTMAFFLLVHWLVRPLPVHCLLVFNSNENVPIGSARQLVYPKKLTLPNPHPCPDISQLQRTQKTSNKVGNTILYDFYSKRVFTETIPIFLEHGINRCFNNDTLLCKYWCATMG